jgi:hypothetical protein
MLALDRLFVATLEALAQTGTLLGGPAAEDWKPRHNSRHLGARHGAGARALR